VIKTGPDQKKFDPSSKGTPMMGGCQAAASTLPTNPNIL